MIFDMKRIKLAEALDEIEQLNNQIERLAHENHALNEKIAALETAIRNPRGSGRKAILTEEMRDEIRDLTLSGETQRYIASVYGVGVATINRALHANNSRVK